MYEVDQIRIVDYNNLYTLFTSQYYKLASSTYLTYGRYTPLVVTFMDYVRFVKDTMNTKNSLEMSFNTPDEQLYNAVKRIEPMLTVLINVISKLDGMSDKTKVAKRTQAYIDKLDKHLGYDILYVYESYIKTIATLQIAYCKEIMKKNQDLKQKYKPIVIYPALGTELDSLSDDNEDKFVEFPVEIREFNDSAYTAIEDHIDYLQGELYDISSMYDKPVEVAAYIAADNSLVKGIAYVTDVANKLYAMANKVHENKVIYFIKLE